MKNFSLKISCLILSLFILAPTEIFAQNMDLTIKIPAELKSEIASVNLSLYDAQAALDDLLKASQSGSLKTPELLERYKGATKIAVQKYSDYIATLRGFERYLDDIPGELSRLASQYAEKQTKIPLLYNAEENLIAKQLEYEVEKLDEVIISKLAKKDIQKLSDMHTYLINNFESKILEDFSRVPMKTAEINKESARIISTYFKPEDVLLAAYEDLAKEGKIAGKAGILDGFKANLRVRQNPPTTGELISIVTDIRKYLRKTNLSGKPGFSFFKLLKDLRGMNMAEREEYVAFLTDLKPNQRKLLEDIGTLPEKGARKLTVKKMLNGPLLIVGTALVVATITEVYAQNRFSNQTISNTNLSKSYKDIKEGNISLKEALDFYTHPSNESEIIKDIDFAMGFYKFALAKSAADDDTKLIEEIIDNTQELQSTPVQQEMEQTIIQNSEKIIKTIPFPIVP